jgi:hypothetical protein
VLHWRELVVFVFKKESFVMIKRMGVGVCALLFSVSIYCAQPSKGPIAKTAAGDMCQFGWRSGRWVNLQEYAQRIERNAQVIALAAQSNQTGSKLEENKAPEGESDVTSAEL